MAIDEIRMVIADYMHSEGCSCCQDTPKHNEAAKKLAEMLNVPMYSDGSGYDFPKFRTDRKRASSHHPSTPSPATTA